MGTGDWGLENGDWGLEIGDRGLGIGDWGLENGEWEMENGAAGKCFRRQGKGPAHNSHSPTGVSVV